MQGDRSRAGLAGELDERVTGGLGGEVVGRLDQVESGAGGEPGDDAAAKSGGAFSPVPTAVPPSGRRPTRGSVERSRSAASATWAA